MERTIQLWGSEYLWEGSPTLSCDFFLSYAPRSSTMAVPLFKTVWSTWFEIWFFVCYLATASANVLRAHVGIEVQWINIFNLTYIVLSFQVMPHRAFASRCPEKFTLIEDPRQHWSQYDDSCIYKLNGKKLKLQIWQIQLMFHSVFR